MLINGKQPITFMFSDGTKETILAKTHEQAFIKCTKLDKSKLFAGHVYGYGDNYIFNQDTSLWLIKRNI